MRTSYLLQSTWVKGCNSHVDLSQLQKTGHCGSHKLKSVFNWWLAKGKWNGGHPQLSLESEPKWRGNKLSWMSEVESSPQNVAAPPNVVCDQSRTCYWHVGQSIGLTATGPLIYSLLPMLLHTHHTHLFKCIHPCSLTGALRLFMLSLNADMSGLKSVFSSTHVLGFIFLL